MNAAATQNMPFAITVGAGNKNAQGKYYRVDASVKAVAEAIRAQPEGVEQWFSLHLWNKNYRTQANWVASSGVVIDIDYDVAKVAPPQNLVTQLLSLATDNDLPGALFYLTPHGCRVAWVYSRPCSDRDLQVAAEQGAAALLKKVIPKGYHIDPATVGDTARFYYTPNCTAKNAKRNAEVLVMSESLTDPVDLSAYAGSYKPDQAPQEDAEPTPISTDFQKATAKWNEDHTQDWPKSGDTCPMCGHNECFGRLPRNPERWFCWSANHGDYGIPTDDGRGHHGDALDLEAFKRGVTPADVLRGDGYLDTKKQESSAKADSAAADDGVQPFSCIKIVDVIDSGPPKFMIDGLWLEGGVGIVGGDPKSWKSFFTVYAAVHVALGRKLFDRYDVKQGRVVIFNAEDTASLTRYRISCICRALEVDIADLDLHLIDTPAFFLDDADHVKRLNKTVATMKPELLILDPLRNLHGLDENDSAILPLVLTPLRLIQREYGCAVQVIHHLIKASEGRTMASRLRGTGALRGWYDSGWVLDRTDETGPVKVVIEHRGAKAAEPFTFDLQTASVDGADAIWFEVGEAKKRPLQNGPSIEEQIIEFRENNPNMSGKAAMAFLRDRGIQFRAAEFWKVWRD